MFFRRYRSEILIILAALAIAACWLPIRMRFPFDDTYITFRYAANLAHGFGIVWNPGGPHTEGYTNFLLVLLLAPFSAMGWDLLAVSQSIGVIAVAISAAAVFEMAAEWEIGLFAAALFIFNPFVWFNAFAGLETSLFTMWILLALASSLRRRIPLAFLFATFAALTRPEGVLIGGALLAGFLWERSLDRARIVKIFALVFALPLACYGIWKLAYFGTLMPNSYYVKIAQAQRLSFVPGIRTLLRFYGGMLPVLPFAAYAIWRTARTRSGNQRTLAISAGVFILLLSTVYLFSQPLMAFYGRFTNSIEAILLMFSAVGMVILFRGSRFRSSLMALIFIAEIAAGLTLRLGFGTLHRDTSFEEIYRQIAPVFRSIPQHDEITLAWADAGVLSYYSGIRFLDVVGLNETRIAHAPNADAVLADIISTHPDLIIIPIIKGSSKVFMGGHGLIGSVYWRLNEWAVASGYRALTRIPQSVYDMELLADTRSPHYADIAKTIVPWVGHNPHFLAPAP